MNIEMNFNKKIHKLLLNPLKIFQQPIIKYQF